MSQLPAILYVSPSLHVGIPIGTPRLWDLSAPGTKLCFHTLTSLREKVTSSRLSHLKVCSPVWPAIIKSDRMSAQSRSWSEPGKGGSLGGLVVEVRMQ